MTTTSISSAHSQPATRVRCIALGPTRGSHVKRLPPISAYFCKIFRGIFRDDFWLVCLVIFYAVAWGGLVVFGLGLR